MRRILLPALLFATGLSACDSGADRTDPDGPSTWQTIQERILQPKCAEACHTAGTPHAVQSDLVLTADVAYEALVGHEPANVSARDAGLLRINPFGATDLYKSYFWVKVNAPEQDRLYKDTPEYGSLMPLGAAPLTYGELNLIKRWLLAGAPRDGVVADETVLQDTTTYRTAAFSPLPELAPTEGMSLRLGPFDVPANFEREFFHRSTEEPQQDLLIRRTTMSMRPGSHHFILYTYADGTPESELPLKGVSRELRFASGALNPTVFRQMQHHVFFAGTQWPVMDYEFPTGVGLHVHAGTDFDLNSHYVNRTSEVREGEVHINLEYANPATVQHVAHVLNLNNLEIDLPPRQVTTLSRTFHANERIQIFQLFSHAHMHMVDFRVEISGGARDGEMIYLATDYEHPPILELDPPLVLEAGQGLRMVTTYNNWTDKRLTFGFSSEDEMMILFGYYFTDAGKREPVGPPMTDAGH